MQKKTGASISSNWLPFAATGEWVDDNDLLYLRARYYNPETGTFTSLDPFEGLIDEPLSLNGYSYAHGNPINHTDPGGEFIPFGLAFLVIGQSYRQLALSAMLGAGIGTGFSLAYLAMSSAGLCGCEQKVWADQLGMWGGARYVARNAFRGAAMGLAVGAFFLSLQTHPAFMFSPQGLARTQNIMQWIGSLATIGIGLYDTFKRHAGVCGLATAGIGLISIPGALGLLSQRPEALTKVARFLPGRRPPPGRDLISPSGETGLAGLIGPSPFNFPIVFGGSGAGDSPLLPSGENALSLFETLARAKDTLRTADLGRVGAVFDWEMGGAHGRFVTLSGNLGGSAFAHLPADGYRAFMTATATTPYGNRGAYTDAEAIGLEILERMIPTTSTNGYVRIYVELRPCESCEDVVEQFRRKYPNFVVDITWPNQPIEGWGDRKRWWKHYLGRE